MTKPHKFRAENADSLLSEERENQGSADSLIRFSGITKRDVVADFGCGPGFLTLPLAGKAKKVYALDINARMLELVGDRLRKRGAHNVELVKSGEYSAKLPEKVDCLFAVSVLHEVARKSKLFGLFHRLIGEGGRLVVADWNAEPKSWGFGPPASERLSTGGMEQLAAGLFRRTKKKVLRNQYYLLFEKV